VSQLFPHRRSRRVRLRCPSDERFLTLSPNHLDRAVGMHGNRLRNASQQQTIQALLAVRAKNNQIRSPRLCFIKNECSRLAVRCLLAFVYLQARGPKSLSSIGDGFLSPSARIFPYLLKQAGGVR
jgi:hypothetical protein